MAMYEIIQTEKKTKVKIQVPPAIRNVMTIATSCCVSVLGRPP